MVSPYPRDSPGITYNGLAELFVVSNRYPGAQHVAIE